MNPQSPHHPLQILVVEDNDLDFKILSRAASTLPAPPTFTRVVCGEEVLPTLLHQGPFDGVFLDLGLPDGDGGQVILRLARHDLLAKLPIFILTGLPKAWEVKKWLSEGAWGLIDKAFADGSELQDALDRLRKAKD